MACEHLEQRGEWQGEANVRGQSVEDMFNGIMEKYLKQSGFKLVPKPEDLKSVYGVRTMLISNRARGKPEDLKSVYGVRTTGRAHGIEPDFMIRNPSNGRTVFIEIKRQKDEGNAHERACKYMMPGIVKAMQEVGNQPSNILPMWWIFTNGIAKDPNYRQAITFWFRGIAGNMLLWEDVRDHNPVTDHFEKHIRDMLV
ncbi:MAG: MunI family type II restriction endonuclease [Rhodobacteraceae bacterium]|nr:MunI family type II restriction endonuclease [Paracoccaceae bacterium]